MLLVNARTNQREPDGLSLPGQDQRCPAIEGDGQVKVTVKSLSYLLLREVKELAVFAH
jgi:hypothetical protein